MMVVVEDGQVVIGDLGIGRIEVGGVDIAGGEAEEVALDLRAARSRAEREVLQLALTQSGGNLSSAAKLLGISRPTLYNLAKEHGLAIEP